MSALSRGSRTKLKQPNSRVDSAVTESIPQVRNDTAVEISTTSGMTTLLAVSETTNSGPTLDASVATVCPIPDFNGEDSNLGAPYTTLAAHDGAAESDRDDRSSSLSDLEDRPTKERTAIPLLKPLPPPEEDDTEAETERLEESPQRLRKHQNVLLSATAGIIEGQTGSKTRVPNKEAEPSLFALAVLEQVPGSVQNGTEEDGMDQTSDISSLEDTVEGTSRQVSPTSMTGKKRKRSSHGTLGESDNAIVRSLKRAAVDLVNNLANDPSGSGVPNSVLVVKDESMEDRVSDDEELSLDGEEEANDLLRPTLYTSNKNKSYNKNHREQVFNSTHSRGVSPGLEDADVNDANDAEESIAEDADMDDAIPGIEADAAVRNEEEILKKKTAMDSLGTIEKHFATLRDRLYEERLAHFNEELAMLHQPEIVHSDYLLMVECINQRRDEKITQARVRLKYKLETLQRRCIGERAIAHGQYMQTIRDKRDTMLEEANKEWYQIQRERRTSDEDEPLYLYQFSNQRTQQIARQRAYNAEVSLLSGIAKYRGFPAAPEITGAKPNEIEDDMRRMGSVPQTVSVRMATSLSSIARQRPAAEEQFLEQTPWANPHHPAHHQAINPAQRQFSVHSRPLSPFTTPATQRRMVEVGLPVGSASTVAVLSSAQNSSIAPTPSNTEHNPNQNQGRDVATYEENILETPSNKNGPREQGDARLMGSGKPAQHNGTAQASPLVLDVNVSPEGAHILSSLPGKPHTFISKGPGPSAPRHVSSPIRSTDLQEDQSMENSMFKPFHSQYPRSLSVGAGGDSGHS